MSALPPPSSSLASTTVSTIAGPARCTARRWCSGMESIFMCIGSVNSREQGEEGRQSFTAGQWAVGLCAASLTVPPAQNGKELMSARPSPVRTRAPGRHLDRPLHRWFWVVRGLLGLSRSPRTRRGGQWALQGRAAKALYLELRSLRRALEALEAREMPSPPGARSSGVPDRLEMLAWSHGPDDPVWDPHGGKWKVVIHTAGLS